LAAADYSPEDEGRDTPTTPPRAFNFQSERLVSMGEVGKRDQLDRNNDFDVEEFYFLFSLFSENFEHSTRCEAFGRWFNDR
jgi:hypothetical protein